MASGGISGKRAVPVTFDKVAKSFGSVLVLEEFDIRIDPGEFLVLLGASGSGKTTALRILSGLETATSGRVRIGDRDVTDILPKYRDISMVFQSYALYPHKTVAENIGFPLKVRKVKAAEMDAAIRDAAAQVQLGDLLHRYPRELSGGQRQRVALARAIIRRPSVFLMDEPLSNLDAKLRGHMRAELKHMQETLGTTTIYVTHDQIEAMTLAHRVAILEKGVLQQLAYAPRDLRQPGQSLRRRIHRLAADEHARRRDRRRHLRHRRGQGAGRSLRAATGRGVRIPARRMRGSSTPPAPTSALPSMPAN